MVITSPMVAANIAAVVSQPRTFIGQVFTHLPMMRRLLVMSITSSMRKGVENPCTMPAKTLHDSGEDQCLHRVDAETVQ